MNEDELTHHQFGDRRSRCDNAKSQRAERVCSAQWRCATSNVDLFRDRQRVIDLDAEITRRGEAPETDRLTHEFAGENGREATANHGNEFRSVPARRFNVLARMAATLYIG